MPRFIETGTYNPHKGLVSPLDRWKNRHRKFGKLSEVPQRRRGKVGFKSGLFDFKAPLMMTLTKLCVCDLTIRNYRNKKKILCETEESLDKTGK